MLALAAFAEIVGDIDLVGFGRIAGSAEVTAGLLMLDKQPAGLGVERQPPAVLVRAVAALIERLSEAACRSPYVGDLRRA